MTKEIRSHIQLPKQILKQFRDELDPEKKVWYLELTTGEIKSLSSQKLGSAHGYFSPTIEKFWDQTIESHLGDINKKVRDFCSGKTEVINISSKEMEIARLFIKSAAVRSNSAYKAMMESSLYAPLLTEQQRHDIMSVIGMESVGPFDQLLEGLHMTILANRTNRRFVVPRNCYYCVSSNQIQIFIIPISPYSAIMLYPPEYVGIKKDEYAFIDDPEYVERMNVNALKYEYMFNGEFVAADRKNELVVLQKFLAENREKIEKLKRDE